MAEQFGPPERFNIPRPSPTELIADPLAVREAGAFERDSWKFRSQKIEFWLKFALKGLLFIFVIWINIYWPYKILQIVQKVADESLKFHLDNSVLIALVTTSVANFVSLVVILAKHLFPTSDPSS
jgi:hypothetical protein